MAALKCDVVVLGSGPGGYVAAIRAGQLGKKVILVERGELGGVCLNVGCIPSKALIHASTVIEKTKKASEMGITFEGVKVDMGRLVEWKNGVVKRLTGGIGQLVAAKGVQVLQGTGTFTAPTRLEVKTAKGVEVVEA